MRTIKQINREISALEKEAELLNKRVDEKRYDKIGREVGLLRRCIEYLETNPREDFIYKQQADLMRKKQLIDEGYMAWLKNQPKESYLKDMRGKYNSEMGMSTLRSQLKNLNYILEK